MARASPVPQLMATETLLYRHPLNVPAHMASASGPILVSNLGQRIHVQLQDFIKLNNKYCCIIMLQPRMWEVEQDATFTLTEIQRQPNKDNKLNQL